MAVQRIPPSSQGPARLSFRCPSCLNVLVVDPRLAGTAAPCPMCSAHIVAPQPVAHGIPFAILVGAQPSPFLPSGTSSPTQKTKSASSSSKVVLADGGLSQSRMEKKDTMATLKMIVFAILTIGACLAAALVLLRA